MAIIAALHDPLAVLLADDLADMMRPDDDGADRRLPGVGAVMSPCPREIIFGTGIATDLPAHVPAAPGGWPSGIRIAVRTVVMVPSGFNGGGAGAKQSQCSGDGTDAFFLRAVFGKMIAYAIKMAA
jgi:hypothetical protein